MTRTPTESSNQWEATDYDGAHSYVFEYGDDLVSLLDPGEGERILDVGCGTGHLTAKIAERAEDVVGVDSAADMIDRARDTYPELRFEHADAREIEFDHSFDAVFSNAALHWIPEQEMVISSIADALEPAGRFVVEMGGQGNVAAIREAVAESLDDRGYDAPDPFYFPSVGQQASLLESHGFEVRFATLFDRPTPLEEGEDGLRRWLEMFGDGLLEPVPDEERDEVVADVEDALRDEQFEDGTWIADYRRLRFIAVLTATR